MKEEKKLFEPICRCAHIPPYSGHQSDCPLRPIASPSPQEPINNCDGCQRGLPINESGDHFGPTTYDLMRCTKERYTVPQNIIPNHIGEANEMVVSTWQEKIKSLIEGHPDKNRTQVIVDMVTALLEQAKAEAYHQGCHEMDFKVTENFNRGLKDENDILINLYKNAGRKAERARLVGIANEILKKFTYSEEVYIALAAFISQAQAGEETK